jgi:DNA-binding transcriptional regulator YiaG
MVPGLNLGGWVSEPTSTGNINPITTLSGWPIVQNCAKVIALATFAVALLNPLDGTGVTKNLEALKHNLESRSSASFFNALDTQINRTAAEDLARIREVLKPAITTLALTFGVSRQSIYNWDGEEQPKPQHVKKLRDLAQVADIFAKSNIVITGALMKRPVQGGKTLLEIAQNDGQVVEAAQCLVIILEREAIQREKMNARLDNRTNARSVESDFPLSNDIV